ncbi:MAG: type II toxin-antitoxin system VapC family toxin [Planctomycetes bacterium]|nr:type II toxin-antitoxin system VapC family toxin [Planctomycetota bacterium]
MRRVLNTNIVSLGVRGDGAVLRHLSRCLRNDVAVTAITLAELEYGSRRSDDPERNRFMWQHFLRGLPVLAFTRTEAPEHARLRDELRKHPIGERDLFIAAIARANGLTVVTRNAKEFKRIKGLRVEEWDG